MLLLSLLIAAATPSAQPRCAPIVATYRHRIDAIENLRVPRTFANTTLALEHATMSLHNQNCGTTELERDVLANPNLYAALTATPVSSVAIDAALQKRWIVRLQRGGAALTPQRRKEFLRLQQYGSGDASKERIAHLFGYETWLDFAYADRAAKSPMRVEKFMQSANVVLKPMQQSQEQQLRDAFAAAQGRRKRAMQPADIPYAEELLEKRHGVDEAQLRQWYPADATRGKILALLGSLFGVSIVPGTDHTFTVSDAVSRRALGTIAIDADPQGGAPVVRTVVPGRAVAIVEKAEDAFTHPDIVAFFGAAGESFRQLLAATPYETLNTDVPPDFAHAPAQMCEFFAWDASALRQIASDNSAGQSIPDALIDKVVLNRTLYNAYELEQNDQSNDTLWARLYADDLFTAFSSGTVLDPAIGSRFRSTILAPAGSLDPDTEVQNFLGRPVNPQAFYKEFTP